MEVSERQARNPATRPDVQCDPCASTDEVQTADHFCTECNEYLCSACTKVHRKYKATKDHWLLDQDEMPREKPSSSIELKCKAHENYPFDYFCQRHDQLCCSVCLNLDHRYCSFEYIKDLSDKQSGKAESVLQKLDHVNKIVKEIKSEQENNVQNIKRIAERILKEVKAFRTEINTLLDALEEDVLEKARVIKEDDIRSMTDLSSELHAIENQLEESRKTMEIYLKIKKKRELTIATKIVEKEVTAVKKNIEVLSARNSIREILFSPNENLLKHLHSVKELGSLKEKQDKNIVEKEQKIDTDLQKDRKQPLPLNITHLKDISIRHKNNKNI